MIEAVVLFELIVLFLYNQTSRNQQRNEINDEKTRIDHFLLNTKMRTEVDADAPISS